jgi:hypothetical protein
VQELINPAIEHYEVAPPSTADDVRATCGEFGFEPSAELIEFGTELGGHGVGPNHLPGLDEEMLNVAYTFKPDRELEYAVLREAKRNLPGYMPIADCNGNELWLRIDDGAVILYNQESYEGEEELVLVSSDLRGLVAGLEPL